MFEKYRTAYSCAPGVADVDLVAAIVLAGVADVVSAGGVWCPSFSYFWDNVCFNFASKWCKRVAVVVMLSVEVCVG